MSNWSVFLEKGGRNKNLNLDRRRAAVVRAVRPILDSEPIWLVSQHSPRVFRSPFRDNEIDVGSQACRSEH
jgi:hypothetical protein